MALALFLFLDVGVVILLFAMIFRYLWIYYSAQILLFGAEFTQVYANTYGSQVEPEDHAVRVKRLEVEVPHAKAGAA